MLRQFSARRILFFSGVDWIGTLLSLALATWLRSGLGDLPPPLSTALHALGIPFISWPDSFAGDVVPIQVYVMVAVIWPFFLLVFSIYDGRRNESLKAELMNVLLAVCVSTMTLAGVLYFTYRDTPRVLFLIFFLLDLLLLLGSRTALWAVRMAGRGRVQARRRSVIIIGAGPVGKSVLGELQKYAWADIDLIGFVDDDPSKSGQQIDGRPVLGTLDQVAEIVQAGGIQDAVVALPLRAHERLIKVCQELQHLSVHVHIIPDLFALSFPNATLDGFGGIPVIDLGRPGIHGWRRFLKRAFDTVAATGGLIVLSPILGLVALLIKLDSPGPVLFKQERIGEDGRLFTMCKFRSMRTDSDPTLHKLHVTRLIQENIGMADQRASLKIEQDPRVTRVGKFIRKTSLDELPQLLNVLRGEMSLVGPRPPIPYEADLYKDWHRRRFQAIPGITGLWQVQGRNRVSFDEMVRMDLEYIERQSIWLDIQILVKTPLAVFSGRGAG
ncbi:MAG: sugar transferase [Chloroflexi bacterium]|nr:sugar transferase [Chloroflexota bacterium]